jgi:hypothetical protein
MQKLYTLRGVSAVCENIDVNTGIPVFIRRIATAALRGDGGVCDSAHTERRRPHSGRRIHLMIRG